VKPFIHIVELDGEIDDRINQAFDFLVDYSIGVKERDGQYPALFLEAPVMGKGGPGSTIPQAFVSGGVIAGARQGGATISLVNNQTWKKEICGNGNINKLAVSEWTEENWRLLYEKAPVPTRKTDQPEGCFGRADQDVIDAGCINLFGWKRTLLVERLRRRRDGD
jgi:hypothetical protein